MLHIQMEGTLCINIFCLWIYAHNSAESAHKDDVENIQLLYELMRAIDPKESLRYF